MNWGPQSGLSILLLHNAMAIILAFVMSQVLRRRLAAAMIALFVSLSATYYLRDVNVAHRLGWWSLVSQPFTSSDATLTTRLIVAYTLLTGLLAPFVFAYITVCRWTTGRTPADLRQKQVRLRALLAFSTMCAMAFGYHHWLQSQAIAYYPTLLVAVCLAVRPFQCLTVWRSARDRHARLKAHRYQPADGHPDWDG